jgi:type VI secretion system protein ImpH
MIVNFMGLTGPQGVMPLYVTQLLMDRLRAKDRALRDFFDLFNHRMISLFYQAWEKYRFPVVYERGLRDDVDRASRPVERDPLESGAPDKISHYLLDFMGLGTRGLHHRQAVSDDSFRFYTGLLSLHTRSALALKQIIADYFEVPVEVEQFVGAWYRLAPANQCQFNRGDSYSEQLGIGAVVGDEIWDQQSGVRVRLGPLTLAQYLDFLPNGTAHAPLRAITRFFAGDELDFEVQLILKREEVPGCELGRLGDAAPQLGWITWAKSVSMARDPDDTILRL